MLKEIIQFTKSLEDLKDVGLKPKNGLYFQMALNNDEGHLNVSVKETALYNKKTELTPFLNLCTSIVENSWMIEVNKCFDLPSKGIHTCSPYCVAFKRESLPPLTADQIQQKLAAEKSSLGDKADTAGSIKKLVDLENKLKSLGSKFEDNELAKKPQIYERMNGYFEKSGQLLDDKADQNRLEIFRNHLNNRESLLRIIESEPAYLDIEDGDYIVIFLDKPIADIEAAYANYLGRNLLNNIQPQAEGEVWGTSGFLTSFGIKKPFLTHQTASFSVSGRMSMTDARYLFLFDKIAGRNILPNPLPIFIYEDEAKLCLPLIKASLLEGEGQRLGYQELIKGILSLKKQEQINADTLGNYYLLFYSREKVADYDFISRFDYELLDNDGLKWQIEPLFSPKFTMSLPDVFSFQHIVVRKMFNNNLVSHDDKKGTTRHYYFDDIEAKNCKTAHTYLLIMKYRRAFYDFIYKSQRKAVTQDIFEDIMLTSIIDDIKGGGSSNDDVSRARRLIQEKLNILFSIHSNFHPFIKNPVFMANQTIQLRAFVAELAQGKTSIQTDAEFAFVAGQVIQYLFNKSQSMDRSYARLEAFLQQTDLAQFQSALVALFNRYKHEKFSSRFKVPFAEVIGYSGPINIKNYMPLILSGFFSNNLLFSDKKTEEVPEDSTEVNDN